MNHVMSVDIVVVDAIKIKVNRKKTNVKKKLQNSIPFMKFKYNIFRVIHKSEV